jgi:DNA-binding XRE family transcriptional regulator
MPRNVKPNLTPEQQARLAEIRRKAAADLAAGVEGPPVPEIDRSDSAPFYFALRSFVGQLRKAREAQGLTLAAVAEKTGLAAETLCRLENGDIINPTWRTLGLYAVAVGKKLRLTAE